MLHMVIAFSSLQSARDCRQLTLDLGLGPLSALELYYGRKINPGWGICFLLSSQMIGYAFTGIYRDILVRPPKIYYPGGMRCS